MSHINKRIVPIDSFDSGEPREALSAYSLRFNEFRVVRETLGGLARHDIEVKCKDGEWRRLGDVIESDEIPDYLNND